MRASEDQLKAMMIGGLDGNAVAHAALLAALVPLLRAFYRRRMRDGGDSDEARSICEGRGAQGKCIDESSAPRKICNWRDLA